MIHRGNFSLVEGFTAASSHNLRIYNKWLGPALGSKVKCHYIKEHNVSIMQLPLKHNSYISRNCWHSIIQEALSVICQGLVGLRRKPGQSTLQLLIFHLGVDVKDIWICSPLQR